MKPKYKILTLTMAKLIPGNPYSTGMLTTLDLLINIGYIV
jgi:hypothetical protein